MNNNIRKKTERHNAIIKKDLRKGGLIITILVLSIVFFLLLNLRKASEVKSARRLVSQTKDIKNKQLQAEKLLLKYQDKDKEIQKLYPNQKTITDFITAIENIGLLVSNDAEFTFDNDIPNKDNNQYSYLSFTMRFTTDLNGFLTVLEKLENIPYLTEVTFIKAQNITSFSDSGKYLLKANVYISESFTK